MGNALDNRKQRIEPVADNSYRPDGRFGVENTDMSCDKDENEMVRQAQHVSERRKQKLPPGWLMRFIAIVTPLHAVLAAVLTLLVATVLYNQSRAELQRRSLTQHSTAAIFCVLQMPVQERTNDNILDCVDTTQGGNCPFCAWDRRPLKDD